MQNYYLLRVDDQSEVLASGSEETHAPLRVPFRGGVEGAVVHEEAFMDGCYRYTRLKGHPPLLEEVAVPPVDDADPEGILHLAEPLLHKVATTVESSFVVFGGAGDVGFVHAALLSEQVAGDGVAVVEPTLVLATCATEDGQDRRLDRVPQLTPSVLHGGVLVSGGGDWSVG
nr:unnamed protein product [Spirometra erinaceieuropaei]